MRDSTRDGCEDEPPQGRRAPTITRATETVEDNVPATLPSPVTDGDVLVRLPATTGDWAATLPPVPQGAVLTVTLGHPALLPGPGQGPLPRGYRIVGVATERRPIGRRVDVFVPVAMRIEHPDWWEATLRQAERVFDLRLGPVQRVLAAELELHTRALAG